MPSSDSNLDFSFLKQVHKPSGRGRKPKNLIGKKFNLLTPFGFLGIHIGARWLCRCDCGQFTITTTAHLIANHTSSCGCVQRKQQQTGSITHGLTDTRIYRLWTDMLTRARNPNYKQAKDYSERGITVCERWLKFENFSEDMGQPPSSKHSIERRNNNLGYSPENCCWATKKEQARNTRANRYITIGDETYCAAEWAERKQLPYGLVMGRLQKGWTPEEALGLIQRTKSTRVR